MKKLILVILFLTMVETFTLTESITLGEPVKFGNNIYMVTNNQGLTATEIFKIGF